MITALTGLTLAAVILVTQENFEYEMEALHRKLAHDALESSMNIIESEFREFLAYKLVTLARWREIVQGAAANILWTLNSIYELSQSGAMSEANARQTALNRISAYAYGKDQYFFVCDKTFLGLAHPAETMVNAVWTGYINLKMKDTIAFVWESLQRDESVYTVSQWPDRTGRRLEKQMLFFFYFPQWEWIIGTSVRIDLLEQDSWLNKARMLDKIQHIFEKTQFAQTGFQLLFDGDGRMYVDPDVLEIMKIKTAEGRLDPVLLRRLKTAARGEKTATMELTPYESASDAAFVYADYFKGMDLYLAAAVSKDAVRRPVNRLISRQSVIILVIFGFGVVSAFLLSEKLATPLLRLAEYARALPRKDFSAAGDPWPAARFREIVRSDEIGLLVESFRYMEDQMRSHIQQLIEKDAFINELVNNVPDGIITFDENGRIESVNPPMEKEFGVQGPLDDASIFTLFDAAVCRRMLARFRDREQAETPENGAGRSTLESDLRVAETSLIPVELRLADMTFSQRPLIICVISDIRDRKQAEETLRKYHMELEAQVGERTRDLENANQKLTAEIQERKAAETALRKSEERYRTLFEDSPISLWEEDFSAVKQYIDRLRTSGVGDLRTYLRDHPEAVQNCVKLTRVLDVNRTTVDMFKAESKADLTRNLSRVFDERSYAVFREQLIALADGRTAFESDAVNRTLAGDAIDIRMKWILVPGYEASAEKVIISIIDITERKAMEIKLIEARNQAVAASRAKSEFLANMSHEIRTPVSGLIGLADMTARRGVDEGTLRNLTLMKASARSLLSILDNILDLSRIEAGRMELSEEPFDLIRVVEDVVGVFTPHMKEKGLSFEHNIHPDVPRELIGDPVRLGQVLRNLIGNAVKFTAEGAVTVRVTLHRTLRRKVALLFTVKDTGVGIPRDRIGDVFEKFRQADSSYAKKFGGSGLGLAICRSLADKMGGNIWAESAAGKGSAFYFTALFDLEDAALFPERQPPPPPDASDGADLPRLSILVAEDDPINQMVVAHFLEDAGHEVLTAEDGRDVLNILEARRVDVIIMDVQMPEMDGLETTRLIRAGGLSNVDPGVPIIALTAYAMKGDREKILQAGVDAYLAKPAEGEDLAAVIKAVLREKGALPAGDGTSAGGAG